MTPAPGTSVTVHGTAIVIGEDGILIQGESGAGKSSLAHELLGWAEEAGRHGALVCDDRVVLAQHHGRLVARSVPAIAGLLEIRGIGIVRFPHAPAAVVRLVVGLQPDSPRLPAETEERAWLGGVHLPRIVVNRALGKRVVVWRLSHLHDR